MRGRPRSRQKSYPAHIDPKKLPKYCYWDRSGSGHWYTILGKKRRKIAGPDAKLSDLHSALESVNQPNSDSLEWLYAKYKESPAYQDISDSARAYWKYALKVLAEHPTKKRGVMLSQIPLGDWNPRLVQKTIDSVALKHGPSSAYSVRAFISRMFNWGSKRSYCQPSPVGKPEMPKQRKRQRVPPMRVVNKVVAFARERGTRTQRKGSCAPYIWALMVILRKCRLRGVEGRTLTEAHLLAEGIDCQRRKGSRANITRVDPALQEALDAAISLRDMVWEKTRTPVPIKPEDRLIFVGKGGKEISRNAWANAWKHMIDMAVTEGVIEDSERFSAHDLKRRGVTDTPGNRSDKMEASGHKSQTGIDPYDHSKLIVDPAPD